MTLPLGVQYNVGVRLFIASVPPVLIQNFVGESLYVQWDVRKDNTSSPDFARITIYNLDPALRAPVERVASFPTPATVQLHVGWGLIPDLLFLGQPWKVTPARKTGLDVLTILECGDGARAARETGPPGGSAAIAVTIELELELYLAQLGYLPVPGALEVVKLAALSKALPAYKPTFDGSPRERINEIMASVGLGWGIQDGFFVVYTGGLVLGEAPLLINPQTGLLFWETLDDGAVEFEALTQARVRPGAQVILQDNNLVPLGGGPTRVESISYSGTSDGPSVMRGTARPLALLGDQAGGFYDAQIAAQLARTVV